MTRKPPVHAGLSEEIVRRALIAAEGSPTRAAEILRVQRGTILYWMRTRNITVKRSVEIA